MDIIIVGICGGSGSGKTTIGRILKQHFKGSLEISMDNYYKDTSFLTIKERKLINFDEPKALVIELLKQDLKLLKKGEGIKHPIYDFKTSSRIGYTKRKEKAIQIVIIDGILLFSRKELRNLIDFKLYVDTDNDIRFIRRMKRDLKERDRKIDDIVKQYLNTVKPMFNKYVLKYREDSDYVISNNFCEIAKLTKEVEQKIIPKINKKLNNIQND